MNIARTTKRTVLHTVLALATLPGIAAFDAACGSDVSTGHDAQTGSLTIIAKTSSAVSLDSLTVTVKLTPVGPGTAITLPPLTLISDVGHGSWTGTFANVPAGSYTLHGDAADGNGTVLYSTTAVGGADVPVTVSNTDQAIAVVLQEVNGDNHDFTNTVPRVVSLADTGSAKVRPGETRHFEFTVTDPDIVSPGTDALTFADLAKLNGADVGTLTTVSTTSTAPDTRKFAFDWTAPTEAPAGTTGAYQVVIGATAVDTHAALVGLSMTITVGNPQNVNVSVNSWPVFNDDSDNGYGITVPGPFLPMNIETNSATTLSSSATDPDGDELTYVWTADDDCAPFVAFESPNANATDFTITSDPGILDSCTVTLTADDGNGGSNTGTLKIPFGPTPAGTSNETDCGDGTCDEAAGETIQSCFVDCAK